MAEQKKAPLRDQAQRGTDCANSQEHAQLRVLAVASQAQLTFESPEAHNERVVLLLLGLLALALSVRALVWLVLCAMRKHDKETR